MKGASLPIPELFEKIKGAKKVINEVVGPEILYRLNVKPLLEDKKKLSTKLGLDRKWCMFAPGMIPFLPRVEGSKFGPNVVLPQIPSLPRVIHTGMGDFKIVKKGVLIPDLSKFNFGPLNDIVKNLVLPMLKASCPGRVCTLSVFEHFLKQFSPGFDFAEAGKRNAADFKGLLDEYMGYVLRKAGVAIARPGGNLPLPPPLNLLWGTGALSTPGTKDCTVSVFPVQNTGEYAYDDVTLVKQYCELANRVWCNGDAKKCDRPGGSIYAHSAGAMTLLEGIKTGYCKKDMKFNVIGAPLKGLTIGESLKKYDSGAQEKA